MEAQISYPQDMLTLTITGKEWYDIYVSVTVSLIIIHDSFRTIRNPGSIHINVDVFRNIFYSYLQ
jgi:hypothetical protein